MISELTWLRQLEQLAQKEQAELLRYSFEWSRFNPLRAMINQRIIELLEAEKQEVDAVLDYECESPQITNLPQPVYCTRCHVQHEEGICQ
jgi:hypothetical protein